LHDERRPAAILLPASVSRVRTLATTGGAVSSWLEQFHDVIGWEDASLDAVVSIAAGRLLDRWVLYRSNWSCKNSGGYDLPETVSHTNLYRRFDGVQPWICMRYLQHCGVNVSHCHTHSASFIGVLRLHVDNSVLYCSSM